MASSTSTLPEGIEPLLTYDQVSVWLNRTPGAVRVLVNRRQIPFVKTNGTVRFEPSAIRAWLGLAPRSLSSRKSCRRSEEIKTIYPTWTYVFLYN